MPTDADNAGIPTVEEILKDRHALADERWDETQWIRSRAKLYAKKNCPKCLGEGNNGMIMEPLFIQSTVAVHGSIRAGSYPKLLICSCTAYDRKEHTRLHRENVSSSEIGLQNMRDIKMLTSWIRDLSIISPSWWILKAIRYTRVKISGAIAYLKLRFGFKPGGYVNPPEASEVPEAKEEAKP